MGPNGEAVGAARELAWARLQWPSRLYCRVVCMVRTTQALLRINLGTLIMGWVLYSTLVLPFSDAARFRLSSGVFLSVSYFVMAGNLLLLLLIRELHLARGALFFIAFLLLSGFYGVALAGEPVSLFAKELVGISVSVLFYASFFRSQSLPASRIFAMYTNAAALVSAIALVIFAVELVSGYQDPYGVRLHYPILEPAHFAEATIPAFYYSASRWLRKPGPGRRHQGTAQFLLLALAILLTGSSVAFAGVLFSMILLMRRNKLLLFCAPAVVAAAGVFLYFLVPGVHLRADSVLEFLAAQDLSQAKNVSVFVLAKCAAVAYMGFMRHPFFGNGLGSFRMLHDQFLSQLGGGGYLSDSELASLNASDANSLFLRVAAELGLVGLILCAWFILRFRVRGRERHAESRLTESGRAQWNRAEMSSAILIFFFIALLREGAYLIPPMCFFFVTYAMLWREGKRDAASQSPETGGEFR